MIDLVFAKPLDKEFLINLAKKDKIWYIFSDSVKKGGIGDILSAFLQENKIYDVEINTFEYDDKFLPHGKTPDVEYFLGLDIDRKKKKILNDKKY